MTVRARVSRSRLGWCALGALMITVGCASNATPRTTTFSVPTASTSAVEESPELTRIRDIVQARIDASGLNGAGLVLVRAGQGIVAEQYWGEFTPTRVSLIASSSKMITATVLLGLAGDGIVDLDTPIAQQVSWAPDFTDITVADLLSSLSGLVGLAPNPLYPPYVCQLKAKERLDWCGVQIAHTSDDDDDVVAPRSEFRYGGAQWQLAGAIAVSLSGMSWDALLDRYLRSPCGVDSLGYTNQFVAFGTGFHYPHRFFDGDVADLPATENPNMEGGAYINPRDYGQLLLLHLNNGFCKGRQVIPARLIERSHQNRLAEFGVSIGDKRGYAMGWWVNLQDGTIVDPGAYGSYAWLDVGRGYGAWFVVESDADAAGDVFERITPSLRRLLQARTVSSAVPSSPQ